MSGKPYVLTVIPVREGCVTPSTFPPFADKLCIPIYAVVQAILNLANVSGSSEFEILSQMPIVCPVGSVGPADVAYAIEYGLKRRIIKLNNQATLEKRYLVNVNMNQFSTNEEIYNDFKTRMFCGSSCGPCPTCTPHPSCNVSQLVPKTGPLRNH